MATSDPQSKESKDVFPCNVTGTQRKLTPERTLGSSFYRTLGALSEDLGQSSVTFEERRPVAVSCIITLSTPSFHFSLRLNNPGSCGERERGIQTSLCGHRKGLLVSLVPRRCSGGPAQASSTAGSLRLGGQLMVRRLRVDWSRGV